MRDTLFIDEGLSIFVDGDSLIISKGKMIGKRRRRFRAITIEFFVQTIQNFIDIILLHSLNNKYEIISFDLTI